MEESLRTYIFNKYLNVILAQVVSQPLWETRPYDDETLLDHPKGTLIWV